MLEGECSCFSAWRESEKGIVDALVSSEQEVR